MMGEAALEQVSVRVLLFFPVNHHCTTHRHLSPPLELLHSRDQAAHYRYLDCDLPLGWFCFNNLQHFCQNAKRVLLEMLHAHLNLHR
jgi:hypothetical protein